MSDLGLIGLPASPAGHEYPPAARLDFLMGIENCVVSSYASGWTEVGCNILLSQLVGPICSHLVPSSSDETG